MTRRTRIIGLTAAAIAVCLLTALSIGANMALGLLTDTRRDAPAQGADYSRVAEQYPETKDWIDSLQHAGALLDTVITATDGRRLHAVYAKARTATDRTAVIVHGWHDSSVSMMQYGYVFNALMGYNILLPDLNGHGQSDGDHINMGWKDRLDVIRWMDIANDIFAPRDSTTHGRTADTQMVLHGVSMGAATVMCVSGEQLKPYVKAVIEDCGYTSVWDEVQHEVKTGHRELSPISGIIIPAADLLCRVKYGWGFKEASPLKQVSKSTLPMLFIHGGNDDFVPTWMVHPLYEAKQEPKEIWIAEGSKHALSYRDHKAEYVRRVRIFAGKYVH